jgi:hypothetical protein
MFKLSREESAKDIKWEAKEVRYIEAFIYDQVSLIKAANTGNRFDTLLSRSTKSQHGTSAMAALKKLR